jgi:hypothetical protein
MPLGREELEAGVERLEKLNARLAATVLMLTYDAHPVWANTAGPGGGIGGQSMTPSCSVIHPHDKAAWIWEMGIHTEEAREVFKADKFDYQTIRNELWAEWQEKNQ